MTESILVDERLDKESKYRSLLSQIEALINDEPDLIANLSNTAAAIKEGLGFFWVGFYLVKGDELVLGPFQGPVACTRIKKGSGVCGSVWSSKKTVIVPDVNEFPSHIACSALSKSEIVVPLIDNDVVIGVLDIDHTEVEKFDETDQKFLEKIANLLTD